MNFSNASSSISIAKAAGYTKAVIGKGMIPQKSSSSTKSKTSGQSSSTSSPRDTNPMSSSGFAKVAKDKGLPFTSPVRPSF